MRLLNFILLDFETTGLSAKQDEILEVSALRASLDHGTLTFGDEFHSLILPKEPIPLLITQLTGITQEMVKASPPWSDVKEDFLAFIGDAPLVAHNGFFEKQ